MAKLTNVKTLDMMNGEITKVAYDGVEYELLGTDVKAKAGDLVQSNVELMDVSEGDFFKTFNRDGDIEFMDGDNDYRAANYGEGRYNVFRKISVQATPALEERVSSLESDVASLKGEKANETIEFEGATYRKVDREAREGDVVIFRKNTSCTATNGKTYAVLSPNEESNGVRFIGEMCGDYNVYEVLFGRTRETVDVYEVKYIPQEGDVVVVIANESSSRNAVGDIGKLSAVTSYGAKGNVPATPDSKGVDGNWHVFDDFRKATPAEVEAYEKAAHKSSFAVGDYVKVVKSYRNLEGVIAKITQIGEFNGDYGIAEFEIEHLTGKYTGETLVADADQLVKATDAEIAKATAPKLKAGDFVKITSGTSSIIEGEIYEVLRDEENELYILDKDGDPRCFPLALGRAKYEIVDAETAKWAKIGREVGEIRKGDVVEVISGEGRHAIGTVGIARCDGNTGSTAVIANGITKGTWSNVKLIAPVESTVA